MKNEFKCSNISFMHNHTLHDTLHRIYVFLFETGMQSEKQRGFALDKNFIKTFREEKRYFKQIKVFKDSQIPTKLVINGKPSSIGAYWI